MAKCRQCNQSVDPNARVCPHCGAEVPKGFFATPWIMLLIVIFVVMEIISGRGLGKPPVETAPQETQKTADENR